MLFLKGLDEGLLLTGPEDRPLHFDGVRCPWAAWKRGNGADTRRRSPRDEERTYVAPKVELEVKKPRWDRGKVLNDKIMRDE